MRRMDKDDQFGPSLRVAMKTLVPTVVGSMCWTKDVIRRYGWSAEKLTGSEILVVSRCVNPLLDMASSGRA